MKFKYTDYHVHTKWSHDIVDSGPSFSDYAVMAEKLKLNVCFLDHYKLYYVKYDKTYPFHGVEVTLKKYLEEVNKVKENYAHVLSGLEVDYYVDMEEEIGEFLDIHEKDFDFIAGAFHETDHWFPFTTRAKLKKLLKKKKHEEVIDEFLEITHKMIDSNLFKNICHVDSIFRYLNDNDIKLDRPIEVHDDFFIALGKECAKKGIKLEFNLSGIRYPIQRPFPSLELALKLKQEGVRFFIGSDSHSLKHFKYHVAQIKEMTDFFKIK
ncbi:MAG: PHP domain-containing protein [Promethearchaeota archaeon]